MPHALQNRAATGFSWPQCGQLVTRRMIRQNDARYKRESR